MALAGHTGMPEGMDKPHKPGGKVYTRGLLQYI